MEDHHHPLWNNGRERAFSSAVVVQSTKLVAGGKRKSFDHTPLEYKYCAGFIVEIEGPLAYIGVHESQICPGGTFNVSLSGGDPKPARIHLRKTECQYVILSVTLECLCHKVRGRKILDRGDILMLSALDDTLVPFYTSAINPSTMAINGDDWRTIVQGSERWFTFGGCKQNVEDIMGAPLFARDGSFIGVVFGDHFTLPEYNGSPVNTLSPDLKYALHAVSFLSNLKKEIKAKLGSKGNKPGNNRRR